MVLGNVFLFIFEDSFSFLHYLFSFNVHVPNAFITNHQTIIVNKIQLKVILVCVNIQLQKYKIFITIQKIRNDNTWNLLRYQKRDAPRCFLIKIKWKETQTFGSLVWLNKTCDKHDKNMMQISMNKRSPLLNIRSDYSVSYCILESLKLWYILLSKHTHLDRI